MATVTCYPASPEAITDTCRITVTEADENTLTGYEGDGTQYPASPEIRYYLAFTLGGEELGRSYVFGTNVEGSHVFNNYVFPTDGSWTVTLTDAADDSSVATASVTVTAA